MKKQEYDTRELNRRINSAEAAFQRLNENKPHGQGKEERNVNTRQTMHNTRRQLASQENTHAVRRGAEGKEEKFLKSMERTNAKGRRNTQHSDRRPEMNCASIGNEKVGKDRWVAQCL